MYVYNYREDTGAMHMYEIKCLVFESHLLGLFVQCRSCHQHCTGKIAHYIGSFVCVKQECSHCGHAWTWKSQALLKDTPVGSILLSASILFSGSSATKVLCMLKHLNMATIKERTFYHHQNKYLEPAIVSVWTEKQSKLLTDCTSKGPLTIGGNVRADSPGHFAKYGSYGIIDLGTNKVIHIELVPVRTYITQ